jgi:hypothetical protein
MPVPVDGKDLQSQCPRICVTKGSQIFLDGVMKNWTAVGVSVQKLPTPKTGTSNQAHDIISY